VLSKLSTVAEASSADDADSTVADSDPSIPYAFGFLGGGCLFVLTAGDSASTGLAAGAATASSVYVRRLGTLWRGPFLWWRRRRRVRFRHPERRLRHRSFGWHSHCTHRAHRGRQILKIYRALWRRRPFGLRDPHANLKHLDFLRASTRACDLSQDFEELLTLLRHAVCAGRPLCLVGPSP
jgi:hypothetical protein